MASAADTVTCSCPELLPSSRLQSTRDGPEPEPSVVLLCPGCMCSQKNCHSEGRQQTLPPRIWAACVHHAAQNGPVGPAASCALSVTSSATETSLESSPSFSTSSSPPFLSECRADSESVFELPFSCAVHGPLLSAVQAELPAEVIGLLRRHCVQWLRESAQTPAVLHERRYGTVKMETEMNRRPLDDKGHDSRQGLAKCLGLSEGRVTRSRGERVWGELSRSADIRLAPQDVTEGPWTRADKRCGVAQEKSGAAATPQQLVQEQKEGSDQGCAAGDGQGGGREDENHEEMRPLLRFSSFSVLQGQPRGTLGDAAVGCVPCLLLHYSVLLFSKMAVLGPLEAPHKRLPSGDAAHDEAGPILRDPRGTSLPEKPGLAYFFDLHKISVGFAGFKKVDGDSPGADSGRADGSAAAEMSGRTTLDALWGAAASRLPGGRLKEKKLRLGMTEGSTTHGDETKRLDVLSKRGLVIENEKLSELECISIQSSDEHDGKGISSPYNVWLTCCDSSGYARVISGSSLFCLG